MEQGNKPDDEPCRVPPKQNIELPHEQCDSPGKYGGLTHIVNVQNVGKNGGNYLTYEEIKAQYVSEQRFDIQFIGAADQQNASNVILFKFPPIIKSLF